MSPPEKPHFETIGHFKRATKKGAHCFHLLLLENTIDEQTSGDIDGDEYDRDQQTLEEKDIDGDRDRDGEEYDRDEQTLERKDIDRDDRDIDRDREDGDEQTLEEKAILEKKAIHEKIMRSCLEYFNQIGFTESHRTLETESRIFNASYFEHLIESGDWKEAHGYLSAFVDRCCGILYNIQMQSSLEVAMVTVLKAGKKLDIGDREAVKCEIIDEVKKLATASFRIPAKLNFPEDSRLWRLFSPSHCDLGLDHKHDLISVSSSTVGHHSRPLIGSGDCRPTHVGGKI